MGVMQVMRSLLMAQPHKESVTGTDGVASFNTDFKGLAKVVIPFTPTQGLHGMPNPYPAGASVNLIPDGTDTENGYVSGYYLKDDDTTVANTNLYISEYFPVDENITYTWSNSYNVSAPAICFYDENKNFISGIAIANNPHTFTPPSGAVYARSSQTTYAYQNANQNGNAYQLEVGSTATAYRRYSNICPISGITSAFIAHTGKNLISRNRSYSGVYPKSGKIAGAGTYKSYFPYVPINKTIYFKSSRDSPFGYIGMVDGTAVGSNVKNQKTMTYKNAWNGTSTKAYNRAIMSYAGGPLPDSRITSYQMMLSYDRQEAFEEPQVNQYFTINWSAQGTMYHGTLTLNEDGSADLISDCVMLTFDSPDGWNISENYAYKTNVYPATVNFNKSALCNWLPWVNGGNSSMANLPDQRIAFESNWNSKQINIKCNGFGVENFESLFVNHPLQVLAYLQSPVSYHFDNIGQLKSFLGTNNIWSDLNGDPTVTFWKHG